jgi:hypothetical protein
MTLLEAVRTGGNPTVVKGCNRRMLPGLFVDLGYKVGAEIGVALGEFSECFCQAGLKMFSVDPWKPYPGGKIARSRASQESYYKQAKTRLAPYGGLSVIVRKTSERAVKDFEDNSLDFVYIDGNHLFDAAAFDIFNWTRKVRPGGIVSGHDYFNTLPGARGTLCHVKSVVDAYVEAFAIKNWCVIEQIGPRSRTVHDDKYPSWFWVKE